MEEKIEDTKGVITRRKLKDTQYNAQMKKDNRPTTINKILHRKMETEQHEPH